ncbi:DUF4350 domain-containing protein [Halobellus ruber]|uniref:DUF4350 domain-containing protein n=1 Tax=Halobellus ruber TaxID=2761102 RepID=A0A7J9SEU3_9EURY|nr:DUF4350 domain-containing protein [Halobellus ruber]MBB6644913.1 hypothetical protein [Halobellus ruber]
MSDRNIVQPLAVLIVALAVVLAGTFAVSALVGSAPTGSPDGATIEGQSPAQYQPDAVDIGADPEDGELAVDSTQNGSRIVIDIRRSSGTSRTDLEPILGAMFEAGHSVTVLDGSNDEEFGDALEDSSGLLIVQPASPYPDGERDAIRDYVDAGGHAVIAGEPTQTRIGGGLFATISQVSFGATELSESYGIRVGAEGLYNVNDEQNDNNFKSIYATPTRGGVLTEGVETVTFHRSGYVVTNSDDVAVHYTAVEGTKTLDTRRAGTYPVVVRNDSVVFVADGSFLSQPELYDADNEEFTGNLLSFLASGDSGTFGG